MKQAKHKQIEATANIISENDTSVTLVFIDNGIITDKTLTGIEFSMPKVLFDIQFIRL